MGTFVVVVALLILVGLAINLCNYMFKKNSVDSGIVKYRGYIFICLIFSYCLYLGTGGSLWGYLSVILLFILCVIAAMKYGATSKVKNRLKKAIKDSSMK